MWNKREKNVGKNGMGYYPFQGFCCGRESLVVTGHARSCVQRSGAQERVAVCTTVLVRAGHGFGRVTGKLCRDKEFFLATGAEGLHATTRSTVSRYGSLAAMGSWVATGNVVSRQGWGLRTERARSRHGFPIATGSFWHWACATEELCRD